LCRFCTLQIVLTYLDDCGLFSIRCVSLSAGKENTENAGLDISGTCLYLNGKYIRSRNFVCVRVSVSSGTLNCACSVGEWKTDGLRP